MIEVVIYLIGCLGAGLMGYGIRALRHPALLRDKRGRFTKRK